MRMNEIDLLDDFIIIILLDGFNRSIWARVENQNEYITQTLHVLTKQQKNPSLKPHTHFAQQLVCP